jgi:hypothetical protein
MRPIYIAIVAILTPFLAVFGACLAGEPDRHTLPTNTCEVVIARIYFEFDSKQSSLLDLHRAATDFLRRKYKEFRDDYEKIVPDGALPTIHIEPKDNERSVLLFYSAGIGHRSWSVAFSKSGKISSHTQGLSVDGVNEDEMQRRK